MPSMVAGASVDQKSSSSVSGIAPPRSLNALNF
jgi:hypothetical protein